MADTSLPPSAPASAPSPPIAVSPSTRRRVIGASFIGNFVEWFDYAAYGYLAATISTVFFPSTNPDTGLLLTFAVFGISFFIRPWAASSGATSATRSVGGSRCPGPS